MTRELVTSFILYRNIKMTVWTFSAHAKRLLPTQNNQDQHEDGGQLRLKKGL